VSKSSSGIEDSRGKKPLTPEIAKSRRPLNNFLWGNWSWFGAEAVRRRDGPMDLGRER
jgi:hypothetical protein